MKTIAFACVSLICILAFTQRNTPGISKGSVATIAANEKPADDVTANWKVGVQMYTFRMFTFTEALNKADSAGAKFIEGYWSQPLGGNMKDSFGIHMSDDSKTKLKQLLASKGIRMVAMGVIYPRTREDWQKAFELAKEFGLSYITTEPGKDQWDMIDSMSASYGIKIAIHEHPRPNSYWSPDSVIAAMKGHPHIGACADLGHWARSGLDPVECLKKLEGHIYGVHLKDIKTFNNTHAEDTVVSKGVLNYPAIFAELKRQKFAGMMSIEHESNWYNSMPDVKETIQYYHQQVNKLK